MRFCPTLFILLCLFMCVCIGAPPKQKTGQTPISNYTNEEDQFIVEELSRIGEKYRFIPVTGKHIWKEIEDNHRKKWLERTQGFNRERTLGGLRIRFLDVLLPNNEDTKVKVPDSLRRKFIDPKRNIKGPKHPYTEEENSFIINELSKYTNTPYGSPVYKEIQAEHDRRRVAKTPGFETERSVNGIGSRITTMKENGLLPNGIMEKFQKRRRDGGEFSNSGAPIELQMRTEDEDAEMADLIQNFIANVEATPKGNTGLYIKYTAEENKLIVDHLISLLNKGAPLTHKNVWEIIAESHRKKWRASTPGFPKERSARSLYKHFRNLTGPNLEQKRLVVPENLMQEFLDPKLSNTGKAPRIRYTKQEEDLIIKELLKPDCFSIFGLPTVQKIQTEFNRKRVARVRGFENERSLRSIRGRLFIMKSKGQLPAEVMEKIWLHPSGTSSSGPTHRSQQTDSQDYDMIDELQNTEWDVDFNVLNFE